MGRTLGRITLTSIIITANVHAAHPTPVKVHRCTCVYTCTGTYTHTHTHTDTHPQDQNQTKQKKLLSYVSHVRMVPDTIIG